MQTSKTKNGKSKTTYIFFHLKFVTMKKFFTILSLKQPNSEERIFAVYKSGGVVTSAPPSQLNFPSQKKSNSFSFKHQGYYFVRVFRNYIDQKFHDFHQSMLQFLDNFRRLLLFFN